MQYTDRRPLLANDIVYTSCVRSEVFNSAYVLAGDLYTYSSIHINIAINVRPPVGISQEPLKPYSHVLQIVAQKQYLNQIGLENPS